MGLCVSKPTSVTILRCDSEDNICRTEIINPSKEVIKYAKDAKKRMEQQMGKGAFDHAKSLATCVETVERRFTVNY